MVKTAAQTAILMAILTLCSKCLGFVREMVMANYFGTSYITDAYVMAQSIPSIIFSGVFAAIGTAYMPLFSEKIEKEGQIKANEFTSQVINLLIVAGVVSSVLGIIFSDYLVNIFAHGFDEKTLILTSFYLKVIFAYTIFSSLSTLFESYLQYKSIFLPQIIIGYSQNIIVIVVIVISAMFSHYLLPIGLLLAYIARIIFMSILVWRREYKYSFSLKGAKKTLNIIVKLAIPVFIGSGVSQINLMVDRFLASGLAPGSIASLNYASLLNNMVITMTISILSTIIYPKLAQANALENHEKFSEIISRAFNLIIIIILPIGLGACFYSNNVVQIVFERGAFDIVATNLTAVAYLYYSVGLLFMGVNDLFIRIHYSRHKMKIPMYSGLISVIINIAFSCVLVRFMGHAGLALATSIAAICNAIVLFISIKKMYPELQIIESRTKLAKIVLASFTAILISILIYKYIILSIISIRVIQMAIVVLTAIIVDLGLLYFFKVSELELLISAFSRNRNKRL